METNKKHWYVMRDLKRRSARVLAFSELSEAGLEVFTPLIEMMFTVGHRKERRMVPVIQDLLFVHESKQTLDPYVERYPNLQYRYQRGKTIHEPMYVRDADMERFICAINSDVAPVYYMPGELTPAMYGRQVEIVGGALNGYTGRLLSVRGLRKKRLLVDLPGLLTAAVEVSPEYLRLL